MKKQIKVYIEAELRDYHQTRKDYEELRDNLLNVSSGPPDGMPRGTETSDPTYQRAVKLITNRRMKYMENVLKGIGFVISVLDEEKLRLVELRYWERPQYLTDAGIAAKLNIDKRTLYRRSDAICHSIGVELGLINEADCHKSVTFEG